MSSSGTVVAGGGVVVDFVVGVVVDVVVGFGVVGCVVVVGTVAGVVSASQHPSAELQVSGSTQVCRDRQNKLPGGLQSER